MMKFGSFRIDGIRPGTYDLAVAMANHFPHVMRAKVSKEDQRLRIVFPEGKTMRGTLVDSEGQPVPHRPVRIRMPNNQAQNTYRRLGFQMFEPITDKNGRFVYHGLPDRHMYQVYVYFRLNGQTYRGNTLTNVEPDAQDLELTLITSMVKVGVGR